MDAEVLEMGRCGLLVHTDAMVEAVARVRVGDRGTPMADALRGAIEDRDGASMTAVEKAKEG